MTVERDGEQIGAVQKQLVKLMPSLTRKSMAGVCALNDEPSA
jgi:hypothetical protein